jgi:very-short-patch-repair endonuclease
VPHSRIEPRIRDYARQNRLAPTLGEKAMWKYLQSFRAQGARFRRQAAIGPYIADFAWLSARIVIEVDGATHEQPETIERDRRKEAFLRRQGFQVFRVDDNEVIANSMQAFADIEAAVRGSFSTPPPTPPHKGEGRGGQR